MKLHRVIALVSAVALAQLPLRGIASDRVIVYPQENPGSTQTSLMQRYPRIAIGNFIRDMLGTSNASGVYTNMTISPVGGLFVSVGPTTANKDGTIYQLGASDTNPVPVNVTPQLAADPTVIMLQGILSAASSQIGPIAVPGTVAQSQYTLIEAQVQSVDTNPLQELFVSPAGGQSYQTVNTDRTDAIVFQAKAGTAGTSPTVPTTDVGWVSIGTILVPYGTSTITSGMIAASTPFAGFTSANGTLTSVTASAPLASSGGTTPNITVTAPISAAYGGTGLSTVTLNSVLLGNGTSALQSVAPGTAGNVLISNGTTWTSAAGGAAGVSSFSAGTTGLTPSTATTGAITLAGTVATGSGGTGLTSFTSGGALYATSTSALTTATLPVASGGTGVTTASGASSLVLRDTNANVTANNLSTNVTSTTSAGATTTLTAASAANQVLTGSANQTFTLPNGTTLPNGIAYNFYNNSTASLTINNNGGTGLYTIPAGGNLLAILTSNGTSNGTWDLLPLAPSNATWGTGGLTVYGAILTGAVLTSGQIVPGNSGTYGTASIYSGNGTPAFSAPAGSLFLSYSGTGGALAYYNSSAAGTSGTSWTAIGTGGGGGGAVYPAPSASPFPFGCQYNTTLPTVTTGNTAQIQCDSNSRPIMNAVISVASPLPVMATSVARTATAGSITAGGTAQNWATAGAIQHGCLIQDTSSALEYIRMDGSAASTSSLQLAANGGLYQCPITGLPTTSVSIYGATTGQTFYEEIW
jgi:hypothetical protein